MWRGSSCFLLAQPFAALHLLHSGGPLPARPSLRNLPQADPEWDDAALMTESLVRMGFPSLETYLKVLPRDSVSSKTLEAPRGCAGPPRANDSERVFLMTVVDPFHGSTALMQTLMASESLGSLCATKVWECEGRELFPDVSPGDFTVLDLYGQHWNLSKPVLFDKSPNVLKSTPVFYETQLKGHIGDNGTLPWLYRSHGIQRLNLAFVAMWRPVCMSQLSRHAPSEPSYDFAAAESRRMSLLVVNIRWLQDAGLPHLVVSLGRLIWSPDETQRRLRYFLPCLPGLSVDYVPTLNLDVFEGNQWKADGSARDYGASHDPRAIGYDLEKHRCYGDWSYRAMLKEDPDLFQETAKYQFFLEDFSE